MKPIIELERLRAIAGSLENLSVFAPGNAGDSIVCLAAMIGDQCDQIGERLRRNEDALAAISATNCERERDREPIQVGTGHGIPFELDEQIASLPIDSRIVARWYQRNGRSPADPLTSHLTNEDLRAIKCAVHARGRYVNEPVVTDDWIREIAANLALLNWPKPTANGARENVTDRPD